MAMAEPMPIPTDVLVDFVSAMTLVLLFLDDCMRVKVLKKLEKLLFLKTSPASGGRVDRGQQETEDDFFKKTVARFSTSFPRVCK